MARRPRLQYPGAVYHVMARGNRKSIIFHDDDDRVRFLHVISRAVARYVLRIIAYCLMPNHYHIVLETPGTNLSAAMQFINGVFAQGSNRCHGLTGHVFEARFRSLVIERDSYLVRAARYVVRNPVRAHLVDEAASWQWSSYRATAGIDRAPGWLHLDWLELAFEVSSLREAQNRYAEYVNSRTVRHGQIDLNAPVLGSKRFRTRILDTMTVQQVERQREQPHRPTLAELFGGVKSLEVRDRLIYTARVEHGYQLTQIALFLGIDRSTASKAATRGEQLMTDVT